MGLTLTLTPTQGTREPSSKGGAGCSSGMRVMAEIKLTPRRRFWTETRSGRAGSAAHLPQIIRFSEFPDMDCPGGLMHWVRATVTVLVISVTSVNHSKLSPNTPSYARMYQFELNDVVRRWTTEECSTRFRTTHFNVMLSSLFPPSLGEVIPHEKRIRGTHSSMVAARPLGRAITFFGG